MSTSSMTHLLISRNFLLSCREEARREAQDLGHEWATPHIERLDAQLDELEAEIAKSRDVEFGLALRGLAERRAGTLAARLTGASR